MTSSFWVLLRVDLERVFRSRIVLLWVVAAAFLGVLSTLNPETSLVSGTVTQGLSFFISIWSLVVVGLSASAVSEEKGEIADSVLSKSVKRHEYILSKFVSRIVLVFTVYAAISSSLVALALRMKVDNSDLYGLTFAVLIVGLALVALVNMGIMLSTILPNTVMAIVALLVVWYAMTLLFPLVDLDFLSPGSLMTRLPNIIQGVWNREEWNLVVSFGLLSAASLAISVAHFSNKDL